MKLYEIKQGSKIKLPITNGKESSEQMCTFNRLDGAYSNISTPDGHIVHLSASAELEEENGHYVLGKE